MQEENVWRLISVDPLFIAYSRLATNNNLHEPSSQAYTGKILSKFGRYTMLSHCFLDSLMITLNDSPKTCWQLILFLARNTIGIGRNRNGDPKLCIRYSPTNIIKRSNIKGIRSFYNAIEVLKEKRIIFIKEKKLYLNLFPLTWNIENLDDKDKIRDIVNYELERVENND